MRSYIMRACVAAAAGVALSTVGVTGASASGAAPPAAQAVRVSAAGTTHAAVSPGTQLWAKQFGGSESEINSVAVSPDGNTVFVTGLSSSDYATIAYKTATGAQLWTKLYKSKGGCSFDNAVAVSPDGKTVFVTGECEETATGHYDYATVAYSAATGAQKWVKGYNGVGTLNYANAVAVSPSGKTVFVTGESDSKEYLAQYATVAYNAATGAQLWVERYSGPGRSDIADAVAVSPGGNTVFVTGTSTSSSSTDTADATVAYNAATGAQVWVERYGRVPELNPAYHNSVAVSPKGGAVYVTGITDSAGTSGGVYATVAYNAATGAQLWAERYSGFGGANSVAVSPDGSTVFVTGNIFRERTDKGVGYGTVAYNAATGAQLWAKIHWGRLGAIPGAAAYSVAVSRSGGTVYVTGTSWNGGTYEYATIAYDAATGAQQWIKLYHGPGSDSGYSLGYAVAVSPTSGTVIVTGYDGGSGKYATVAYRG
jgi:sugar lactone lactonase YvrE